MKKLSMRIGELAQKCGVNPKTVRYYEAFGLLPKAARAPSGHRIYLEHDLQRLRFIRRAKQIGLPLTSIRQITTHADAGSCKHLRPRLKQLIAAQLTEIKGRIKDLAALQRELRRCYASLCQPQAQPSKAAGCSCLDGPSLKTSALPAAVLVKRPPSRKSRPEGGEGNGQASHETEQAVPDLGHQAARQQQLRLRLRDGKQEVRGAQTAAGSQGRPPVYQRRS